MDEEEGRPFTHQYTHNFTYTHTKVKSMRNVKIFYNTEKGEFSQRHKSLCPKNSIDVSMWLYFCVSMCVWRHPQQPLLFPKIFTHPTKIIFLVCFCVYFRGCSILSAFSLPACLMSIKSAPKVQFASCTGCKSAYSVIAPRSD